MHLTNSLWSERRDSNPRPSPWEGDILPTELLSQVSNFITKILNLLQRILFFSEIHMLQRRTNILLDEETHKKLKAFAEEKNVSMGHLVREAISEYYA